MGASVAASSLPELLTQMVRVLRSWPSGRLRPWLQAQCAAVPVSLAQKEVTPSQGGLHSQLHVRQASSRSTRAPVPFTHFCPLPSGDGLLQYLARPLFQWSWRREGREWGPRDALEAAVHAAVHLRVRLPGTPAPLHVHRQRQPRHRPHAHQHSPHLPPTFPS